MVAVMSRTSRSSRRITAGRTLRLRGVQGSPRSVPPALESEALFLAGAKVFAAVARTDEMLTGMLIGVALAALAASAVLVRPDTVAGRLLVAVSAAILLSVKLVRGPDAVAR